MTQIYKKIQEFLWKLYNPYKEDNYIFLLSDGVSSVYCDVKLDNPETMLYKYDILMCKYGGITDIYKAYYTAFVHRNFDKTLSIVNRKTLEIVPLPIWFVKVFDFINEDIFYSHNYWDLFKPFRIQMENKRYLVIIKMTPNTSIYEMIVGDKKIQLMDCLCPNNFIVFANYPNYKYFFTDDKNFLINFKILSDYENCIIDMVSK